MNLTHMLELASECAVVLYFIASGISAAFPGTRAGLACAKMACALRHVVEKKLPPEDQHDSTAP